MGQSPTAAESSLLLTLEEISRLVSHSHHPGETLANIVGLIQQRFHTEVCSVYWHEPQRADLVLGATIGLAPESVGRVRMRLDEGLTGLTAQKMCPVMVEDAFTHPRFKFFPEAGEDPYHSFLGVPLVEGGLLQGVLVVQTREPRHFTANEIRMLVAVAAQLAPLVSEALLLEQVVEAAHEAALHPPGRLEEAAGSRFTGVSLSPGIGAGSAYLINGFEEWHEAAKQRPADLGREEERLERAMDAARAEIGRLGQHLAQAVGEDHGAILQSQLMILQDDHIGDDVRQRIADGAAAEGAILETLDKYVQAFQKLQSPMFRERVYDIKDVFRRLLWHLRPVREGQKSGAERVVLVAHEASVMDLFSVDRERIAGVLVESGGPQSHAAILARSLGIPMVGQVPGIVRRITPGRVIRVDGQLGLVELDAGEPAVPVAAAAPPPGAVRWQLDARLPRLEANLNLLSEARPAMDAGALGIGLYRSEFLFLARRTLPTEEEQVEIYRKLLQQIRGRPASIRTFDLRPDKLASYARLGGSAGDPYDWRLVLSSQPMQKLFKEQVRAILRAAVAGPARILVPLVTCAEQLDFVVETLGRARDELRREGQECKPDLPLGIMLEVAAATVLVDSWVNQVDFFALGTNDLTSSVLGIDREHPVGATRHDALHPGLLRIIDHVIEAAHGAGRRVSVCGEMAGDPEGAIALAALQVDSLSVAVPHLPAIGQLLALQRPSRLAELRGGLMGLRTASEIRDYLQCHSRLPSGPIASTP